MIIALLSVACLFLVFAGAYVHYQWSKRGYAISSNDVVDQPVLRQLYEQGINPNMISNDLSAELNRSYQIDEGRFFSHVDGDAFKGYIEKANFKSVAKAQTSDDASEIFQGTLEGFPVTILVGGRSSSKPNTDKAAFTSSEFVGKFYYVSREEKETESIEEFSDENDQYDEETFIIPASSSNLRYLQASEVKFFYPSTVAAEAVTAKVKQMIEDSTIYQKVPVRTIKQTTTVYRLINSDYGNSFDLDRADTQSLFKYEQVLEECPEMFGENFKASFNERNLPFNGKQTFEFMSQAYNKCKDHVFSGILFGKAGTGKTSYLHALAFHLGKDSNNKVVLVDGTQLTDAGKTASLLTLLRRYKDVGQRVIICVDEADNILRNDKDGNKTEQAAALMSLMNDVSVICTCNLQESQLNSAFLRTGRGDLLVHIGEFSEAQKLAVTNYLKERAKKDPNLEFHLKEIHVLSDAWAQLQPRGLEDLINEIIVRIEGKVPQTTPSSLEPAATAPSENNQTFNPKNLTVGKLKRFNSNNKKN